MFIDPHLLMISIIMPFFAEAPLCRFSLMATITIIPITNIIMVVYLQKVAQGPLLEAYV